jgi:hypothetical protein
MAEKPGRSIQVGCIAAYFFPPSGCAIAPRMSVSAWMFCIR